MKKQNSLIKLILLSSVTVVSGLAQAQYYVSGKVVETAGGEPLPATVYHIYNATDTIHPIVNDIADDNAEFKKQLPTTGKYFIDFEYVGFNTTRRNFEITGSAPAANLGEVVLDPAGGMLAEVTVTAKKALVVSDGANLKYNVKEDPSSQSSSVLEMLRKVPMVTVDGEDNIMVNGSSDFKIYLNGRPNAMFNSEPQKVLKAMPANSITRIEVLTEPGAKYDAEGLGGILNIVIEAGSQQVADGYAGNVNLSASARDMSASAYVRGKRDKVTASASGTYSDSRLFDHDATSSMVTDYLNNPIYSRQIMDSYMKYNNRFYFAQGNLDMSWEPNVNNLFTFNANVIKVEGSQFMTTDTKNFGHDGSTLWQQTADMDGIMDRLALTANISYQHLFGRQDHYITGAFQYDRANNTLDIFQEKENVIGEMAGSPCSQSNNFTQENEYTVQVDYSNQLTQTHLIEAGSKLVVSDNTSKSKQIIGDTPGDMKENPDDHVKMNQYKDIAAVYGAYTATLTNWRLSAGLRYEYTHQGADFLAGDYDNFSSDLNDLVPNASVTYSLSPSSNLRAAYNMRISRPTIDKLNPFRFEIGEDIVKVGNPDLESQTSNNISLSFSSYTGKLSYNIKAEYQIVDNMISDFIYMEGTTQNHTYMNAGKQQQVSLSGFANCYLTPKMSATISARLSYADIRVKSMDLSNSGWLVSANASWNYTLPADIKLTAYGGWSNTSYILLQGNYGGWYYYGLGLNKSFLKDKSLTVGVSCSNMFEKYSSWKQYYHTSDFNQTGVSKLQNWNVGVNLSWNFGSLKQDVKKTRTKIDNNDAPETSKSGSGGIL